MLDGVVKGSSLELGYEEAAAQHAVKEIGTFFWTALAAVLAYVLLVAGCAAALW